MKQHLAYVLIVAATVSAIACSSTPKPPPRADYPVRKIFIATDNDPVIGLSGGGMSASDLGALILLSPVPGGGSIVRQQHDSRVSLQRALLQQALAPSQLKPASEMS